MSYTHPVDPRPIVGFMSILIDYRVAAAPVQHVHPGQGPVVPPHMHRHTAHIRVKHRRPSCSEVVNHLLNLERVVPC